MNGKKRSQHTKSVPSISQSMSMPIPGENNSDHMETIIENNTDKSVIDDFSNIENTKTIVKIQPTSTTKIADNLDDAIANMKNSPQQFTALQSIDIDNINQKNFKSNHKENIKNVNINIQININNTITSPPKKNRDNNTSLATSNIGKFKTEEHQNNPNATKSSHHSKGVKNEGGCFCRIL